MTGATVGAGVAFTTVSPVRAFRIAPRMPRELYVAPVTASSSHVWFCSTASMTVFASVIYGSVSPGALTTVTSVICRFSTVTRTVMRPP